MKKVAFILLVALGGCSKEKQETTISPTKPNINVRWETFGTSGITDVKLNYSKTLVIGSQYELKQGDGINYIIEAKGQKVVFKIFNNLTKKVIYADSNNYTFNGVFKY